MARSAVDKAALTWLTLCLAVFWISWGVASEGTARGAGKRASALYPARVVARARKNARAHPWAAGVRDSIAASARPWMELSDEQLWDMMFSNTIKRSWMVWSNGHCPSCRNGVPMYTWEIDALERPWKVRCPHCRELFPKNDFHRFYRSGLNDNGTFQPGRADRSLLFNVDHPGPEDPLRSFGVDDGEGYTEDDKRWRFIGAYLIYGQWKQAIVGGIRNLAAAHLVTGEPAYARKAGVLLDRVADLYPTFDFGREGVLYEGPGSRGYVSTWHDACVEVRDLALAYDQIFEAISRDGELAAFLARKAKQHKLGNPKTSFAAIQENIEERVLRDTLRNRPKIESNYPQTDMAVAIIKTVLGWPGNREEVAALLDGMVDQATAVDGLSGEKGLAGYATIAPRSISELLGLYTRVDPGFLKAALKRQPRIHAMYRFHLDARCLRAYYPRSGDTGVFAQRTDRYPALSFSRNPGIGPSAYAFLWELYALTGDTDLVRVLYQANGNSVEGLPYDLFAADPRGFQGRVAAIIDAEGARIRLGSVNKREWHLAILRAGKGPGARAVWLDYDSGGRHGHADAMNLGLFAKGLDLMPDFGYPPVHYGGWGAPRAVWYTTSAAHNTVVVDGKNSRAGAGKTTLWADGKRFRAIRASAAGLVGGQQFERTVALVDLTDLDSYVVDIFRVVGGLDHSKFMHSHFGRMALQGVSPGPSDDYGRGHQMRNFRKDAHPPPIWHVDWTIEDRLRLLPRGRDIRLRYTDLTGGAEFYAAEAWVSAGGFNATEEAWIPRVVVRRRAERAPLASTFLGVIEPYETTPAIARIRRLRLETESGAPYPEASIALEVREVDGRSDLLVSRDVEDPLGLAPSGARHGVMVQKEAGLRFDGELCLVRRAADGELRRVVACRGRLLSIEDAATGSFVLELKSESDCVEVFLEPGKASLASGSPDDVKELRIEGRRVRLE